MPEKQCTGVSQQSWGLLVCLQRVSELRNRWQNEWLLVSSVTGHRRGLSCAQANSQSPLPSGKRHPSVSSTSRETIYGGKEHICCCQAGVALPAVSPLTAATAASPAPRDMPDMPQWEQGVQGGSGSPGGWAAQQKRFKQSCNQHLQTNLLHLTFQAHTKGSQCWWHLLIHSWVSLIKRQEMLFSFAFYSLQWYSSYFKNGCHSKDLYLMLCLSETEGEMSCWEARNSESGDGDLSRNEEFWG